MRLHHLSVRAFGPFAEPVEVDFGELNDAGLFLLTGATGAGKSSLLDAVCFALYGVVPGARGVKSLKSQHAPADARPEVVLDFAVQGRRFVVRRSPEWTRPKRRGAGETTEKASASITETTDGVERFLSSRAAEVGLLVGDLMGMNAGQFVQVALLPQGEFQTFLRASSQERHDVLEALFRTDRFTRIEEWVHDRSRLLRQKASGGESTVRRILDTVSERAGSDLPEELADQRLAASAAEGRVLPWVETLVSEADRTAAHSTGRRASSERIVATTREQHAQAVRAAAARARRAQAQRVLDELADTSDSAVVAEGRLDDDQRARPCLPLLARHAQSADARRAAERQHDRSLALLHAGDLGPDRADPTRDGLGAALSLAAEQRARLELLLPRETHAAAARRDRDVRARELAVVEAEAAAAQERQARLPAALATLEARRAEAAALAATADALEEALTAARGRQDAEARVGQARADLLVQEGAQRAAREESLAAREHLVDVTTRRLAGMSAELAAGLVDGEPCGVCGSPDHPLPAQAAPDAVGRPEQESAQARVDQAAAVLAATEEALHKARRRHDEVVVASGGLTERQAADAVRGLAGDLRRARAAGLAAADAETTLSSLRTEQFELADSRTVLASRAASLRQSLDDLDRTIEAADREVRAALGIAGPDARTIGDALETLRSRIVRLEAARETADALAATSKRTDDLIAEVDDLARQQGFSSLDALRRALLEDADRDHLAGMLASRASTEARAQALLEEAAETEVDAPEPSEVIDPARLADRLREVETAFAEASRLCALHDDRAAALRRLHVRLAAEIEAWAPMRDDALLADSMAKLVRGMGADNHLQMRLSAYVLATRLDQVVAAANERLSLMRDQRYLLQRTGRADRKGTQAGLGLEVVDQWTGDVRAPTTLSGGETFVVSLSLALGLADVVTHESGGTEVETLFVDEGFGTLDADTLDDVMDRLDGLRAGGRTVGVVSHVTELRTRIPTQVHVDKGRSGSTVSVATLVS